MVGSPQVRRVETKQEASCRKPAPLSQEQHHFWWSAHHTAPKPGQNLATAGACLLRTLCANGPQRHILCVSADDSRLRSCDPDDFDRSSSDWSGSRHCNDRCLVAREAQFLKGIADGVEQAIQFWSTPILGVLSDSVIGRRPIGISSVTGLMLSVLALGCAALARRGDGVLALVVIGSAVKGTTECFT